MPGLTQSFSLRLNRRLSTSLSKPVTPLTIAPNSVGAYSLRNITGGGNPAVVRVRRASDNEEQDFTEGGLTSGELTSFLNDADIAAPLDLRTVNSSDKREGSLITPEAAYSLRSLGTNQATVAATGDTVARADGKYVVQVRRSSDDALKSFTATEITDGTLLSFVGTTGDDDGNVKTWYDQSGNNKHATQSTAANQPKVVDAGALITGGGILFDGNDQLGFAGFTNQEEVAIFSVVKFNNLAGDIIGAAGGDASFGPVDSSSYHYSNTAGSEEGDVGSITLDTSNTFLFGLKYQRIDVPDPIVRSFVNGNAGEQIEVSEGSFEANTIGANGDQGAFSGVIKEIILYDEHMDDDRTAVENNIANHYNINLVDGIDMPNSNVDGFVSVWYDQSGSGNHATQTVSANQPKIAENSQVKDHLLFDGYYAHFNLTSALDFDDGSGFFVVKGTTPENQQTLLGGYSGNNYLPVLQNGSSVAPYTSSLTVGSDFVNGASQSWADRDDAYDAIVTNNYVLASFIDIDNSPSATFKDIGRGAGGNTWVWEGEMKEIVLYSTNQSTNRTALEANMNSYYSIF